MLGNPMLPYVDPVVVCCVDRDDIPGSRVMY